MKAILYLAGLTLLLATLVEGGTFRHQTRKQLKKPLTHALRRTNPKTTSGKIIVNPKILVPKPLKPCPNQPDPLRT